MISSAILIILICIGIIYLIMDYRKRLQFFQAANALPGPKTQPILGNSYYFLQRNFDEFLNSISSLMDIYPSPFRFWLGNKLIIFINEPDQIKVILQHPSCFNKNVLYDTLRPWLGTGLITAPAQIWFGHRKMIASSFNTNILRGFCDIFVEQTSVFMEKLEHMVNDEIDPFQHVTMCTLDIIYDTSLGTKLGSQLNENNMYVKAIMRLKEIILHRIRNIFLFPDIVFNFTPLSREQQKHLNFIYSTAEKVIEQKENARDNLVGNQNQSDKPPRKVFLDLLMEASDEGKKFTKKDIIDEINTISFAGSDTTAVTLNFTMFILANFPEVQQKVYEELLEIYGTQDPKSTPIKFEDLQYMNYMERVIKETLRLFPVVPLIGRRLNDDLQIGECTIPKGADFMISILFLHRNENYWPKPLTFDPDRFLPENMANIHPYSYIPFSNGPRNCLGMRYAMTSMKVLLATLLRTYILKMDKKVKIEDVELKMDILLVPMKPLKIRIEKRK
ncbi:cytochrome P450 4C1-like isoform X2 [Odontomachus brunneus]|uniref:cytochrome P450 4C1-like isoform X1 n=1 Tax=Odontomachus brunneus TaxID=486640 RepID=UPI0013F1FE92|nr:cytochrome P450 4C1-like isoform X1 [Odontomachus brunneus]XP_032667500.1 cytochrome P450 4C1-like isoform X2 [Odontomachus brunneus]XP_032667501.1 cytochrome P450 4C1-like isoform X2 [Odontomachus brunneus]XP_032667502.1 cytochrome P450 4C1-like isoform X2 [Odontomachus brunneus]